MRETLTIYTYFLFLGSRFFANNVIYSDWRKDQKYREAVLEENVKQNVTALAQVSKTSQIKL